MIALSKVFNIMRTRCATVMMAKRGQTVFHVMFHVTKAPERHNAHIKSVWNVVFPICHSIQTANNARPFKLNYAEP